MSDMLVLAAALDRHTKALETCAAALSNGEGATKTPRKARAAEATPQEPAAAPAATPTPATPAAAPAAAAPASAASAAVSATGPTLQKVADAIIDLANTVSREAAVGILSKYGAAKVPQLKPADFIAVLADVASVKSGLGAAAGPAGGLM